MPISRKNIIIAISILSMHKISSSMDTLKAIFFSCSTRFSRTIKINSSQIKNLEKKLKSGDIIINNDIINACKNRKNKRESEILRCEIEGQETFLNIACILGSLEVFKLLVKYGHDVNERAKYGDSPLLWACIQNHQDIFDFLLKNNANPNTEVNQNLVNQDSSYLVENNPVSVLCKNGENLYMLEKLLPRCTKDPERLLKLARLNKRIKVIEVIEKFKSKKNIKNAYN